MQVHPSPISHGKKKNLKNFIFWAPSNQTRSRSKKFLVTAKCIIFYSFKKNKKLCVYWCQSSTETFCVFSFFFFFIIITCSFLFIVVHLLDTRFLLFCHSFTSLRVMFVSRVCVLFCLWWQHCAEETPPTEKFNPFNSQPLPDTVCSINSKCNNLLDLRT